MNRQKWLLGVVGLLAVVRFAILPAQEVIERKTQEYQRLTERLDKGARLISEVENMSDEAKFIDDKINVIKQQFEIVPSEEVAQLTFQQKIESEAEKHGIKIDSIEWAESKKGTPSYSVLNLKVDAQMYGLMLFHSGITQLGYGVVTTQLNLNSIRQNMRVGRLGRLRGQISLRIFYLVEDAAI